MVFKIISYTLCCIVKINRKHIITSVADEWKLTDRSHNQTKSSSDTWIHTERIGCIIVWFTSMIPAPIFSSTLVEPIWPLPVDMTVQANPNIRAVTSSRNCVFKFLHFFSVSNSGQVCVPLSAVALSFSPGLCIRHKVVLMEEACGEGEAPWGWSQLFVLSMRTQINLYIQISC